METFFSLLRRIQRCVDEGRLVVDDVHLAGEAVWASVHGHMMIERLARVDGPRRGRAFAGGMRLLALGYGDQPETLDTSMRRLAQVALPARRSCLRQQELREWRTNCTALEVLGQALGQCRDDRVGGGDRPCRGQLLAEDLAELGGVAVRRQTPWCRRLDSHG